MGIFSKNKVVNKVVLISVDQIQSNPAQPRTIFDSAELISLSESINENGILQPLTVRLRDRASDGQAVYELIAGERRLKAAQLAHLGEVPCIVLDTDSRQSAIFAILENIQRQDLNFFEEARAISNLIIEWNVTQEEASKRLGKAQSTIANKLRLLKLSDQQQKKIIDGGLTERHARAILKLNDPLMEDKVIYYISAKKLNVKQTEEYIETVLTEQPPPRRRYIHVIKDVRLFLNTINKAIETMQKSGVDAQVEKVEHDESIEYIVRIPIQNKIG